MTHTSIDDIFGLDDARLEQAVKALARFHDQWWANESLLESLPTAQDLLNHPHARDESYDLFAVAEDFLAGNQLLTPQEKRQYETLLRDYTTEPIVQQMHRNGWFTIKHGDLWHGNVLFGDSSAIIIDWSNWSVSHPVFDLAYLICLASTPQNISLREGYLIDLYLTTLSGLSDFSGTSDGAFKNSYFEIAKKSVILLPVWLWKDGQMVWKRVYKPLLHLL